jgi:hypothetical protein
LFQVRRPTPENGEPALLKNVERKIDDTEKIPVIVRHADGRDMRSDLDCIPMYGFRARAKGAPAHSGSSFSGDR